ncbi:hypothetical protein ABTX82_41455 [Streptomyces lavendulae]|uniref:hypothetical protein n=1 Tax=Streptomyces lavendulae TaxID=1914 RepID=UPI00332DC365
MQEFVLLGREPALVRGPERVGVVGCFPAVAGQLVGDIGDGRDHLLDDRLRPGVALGVDGGEGTAADEGEGPAQGELGPPVGARRLDAGLVGLHRLVDGLGRLAELGQDTGQVDSGLLQPAHLPRHRRPVLPRHQVGHHPVVQERAQCVGGPARRELLLRLSEFLLLTLALLLGGTAYGIRDRQHQPERRRRSLDGLSHRLGERIDSSRVRGGGEHDRGSPRACVMS